MEKRSKPSLHYNWIDPDARSIVDRLQKAGFTTYLVGGCVRDLLAGIHPKDFDIATSALPEQVRKIVRGSYIIGRRFQLVLVKRGNKQFEVATFRRAALPEELESSEFPQSDNFFGSPKEDAQRRDFTINGLFYDPIKNELIDYVEGIPDIEQGLIRMIGPPDQRLKEDPIRILRAVRLSHKLRFSIESNLRGSILANAQEISRSILPRKREEYLKLMRLDNPGHAFLELFDLGVLPHCLPTLSELWKNNENSKIISHYLNAAHHFILEPQVPTDLMIPLLLAFDEIFNLIPTQDENFNMPQLENFFRNEWGLFKLEQQSLLDLLQLLDQIKNIDSLMRKGQRRQRNFISKDGFEKALVIANNICLISGNQWLQIEAVIKKLSASRQADDNKALSEIAENE